MKIHQLFSQTLLALTLSFGLCHPSQAQFSDLFGPSKTIEQKRQDILKSNAEILQRLYKLQPKTKGFIESSAGYATFSNFGMKILIAGGGTGTGVVINNKTKKPIFMNMAEVQAGLGIGIKSFNNIFIFQTQDAMNDFINSGWTFGGQTTAAAKYGKDGDSFQDGAIVAEGVLMYQLTDSGLAAEITGKGTKYYKDSDLNK
jgi:lipid-binding SYLF domain-containing protein